ncbi:MAG: exodeoxyribonuclease V subunit gamma [Leptonema sp. (in: bacteria)]
MIQIYTANNLEILFDQFVNDIKITGQQKENPYDPYFVLIPNKNIEYWLRQKIAESQNICINFKFDSFEEGIWQIFSYYASEDETFFQKIDPYFLSLIIYQIFLEETGDIKYFDRFLKEHKDFPGNIYNLSLSLSETFFRYHFHKPFILQYFENKKDKLKLKVFQNSSNNQEYHEWILSKDQKQQTEKIDSQDLLKQKREVLFDQEILYNKALKKILEFNNKNKQNYCFFFDKEWRKRKLSLLKEKKVSIFIFAFQYNNDSYYNLLNELQYAMDIYYYQILLYNPNKLKEPIDLPQNISYNNIKLLEKIVQKSAIFKEDKNKRRKNLLNEMQQEFLNKGISATLKNNIKLNDNSIKLIEAPEKKVEIKAVIQDIQEQLLKDPNLKLNEIAILAPDIEKYFPLLKGYLDYIGIPYNIQDPSLKNISYFSSAVLTVLNILDSLYNKKVAFTNEQILNILENPIFQKNFNLKQDDVSLVYKLINSLKIYFDDDREPYHSWEIALKRIRSGRFTNETLICKKEDKNWEVLPYFDFEINIEFLEKIHSSITQLIEDIKDLYRKMLKLETNDIKNIQAFYNDLNHFFNEYFDIHKYPENFHIEAKSYFQFQEKLYYLKILNILPKGNFLYTYFDIIFSKTLSNVNEYLFHGITISSMQPLRPIPFKRIYILGLNQEDFPGKEIKSHYDLIEDLFEVETNEINILANKNILKITDRNLFLFYEIFLSAREQLTLSYVRTDLQNNKKLYPSYVYSEIKNFLEANQQRDKFQYIPHTLKIKENKIFNHIFEFSLSLLANYRKDLNSIRNLEIKEILREKYLKDIMNCEFTVLSDLYIQKKFQPEHISFTIDENNILPILDFLDFIENPILYYFKKHKLLEKFSNIELEVNESKYDFDLSKNIKREIFKKILLEYLFDSHSIDLEKAIIDTIHQYSLNGLLNFTNFKQKFQEYFFQLFKNLESIQQTKKKKEKANILLSELRSIKNKYYKNSIYLNPYIKEEEFNLIKEIEFPSITFELPAFSLDNYKFEGTLNKEFIIDLDQKCIYFLSFYEFEHTFKNYFFYFSIRRILSSFKFYYIYMDLQKEIFSKKELNFDHLEKSFITTLKTLLLHTQLRCYDQFLIEAKNQFEIKKYKLDFEDINNQLNPLIQHFYEEVISLNLQDQHNEYKNEKK